jgi:hypothetical protein
MVDGTFLSHKNRLCKDIMKKAVEEVNDGKSIHQATEDYSIPYPTLRQYTHKYRGDKPTGARLMPKYNNCKVFFCQTEEKLVNYLLICSKMCFGIDTRTCRCLACELAVQNNLNFRGNWKEGMTGIDWFYGFMK